MKLYLKLEHDVDGPWIKALQVHDVVQQFFNVLFEN